MPSESLNYTIWPWLMPVTSLLLLAKVNLKIDHYLVHWIMMKVGDGTTCLFCYYYYHYGYNFFIYYIYIRAKCLSKYLHMPLDYNNLICMLLFILIGFFKTAVPSVKVVFAKETILLVQSILNYQYTGPNHCCIKIIIIKTSLKSTVNFGFYTWKKLSQSETDVNEISGINERSCSFTKLIYGKIISSLMMLNEHCVNIVHPLMPGADKYCRFKSDGIRQGDWSESTLISSGKKVLEE